MHARGLQCGVAKVAPQCSTSKVTRRTLRNTSWSHTRGRSRTSTHMSYSQLYAQRITPGLARKYVTPMLNCIRTGEEAAAAAATAAAAAATAIGALQGILWCVRQIHLLALPDKRACHPQYLQPIAGSFPCPSRPAPRLGVLPYMLHACYMLHAYTSRAFRSPASSLPPPTPPSQTQILAPKVSAQPISPQPLLLTFILTIGKPFMDRPE